MEHFAWPLGIAIIVIAALIILRPAFMRLIDRTSKAGKDGVSFERPQEGVKPETPLLSSDELMKLPITASVLARERNIKTNLQAYNLKTDPEQIEVLIRSLALSRLELEFNNIASAIFGSQLTLLLHLSSTTQGISIIFATTIFNQAKETFPSFYVHRSFDDWLNYLLGHSLIIKNGDKLDITQYGLDFLKHLVDARLTYERQG